MISNGKCEPGIEPLAEIVQDTFTHIANLDEGKEAVKGLSTGFDQFDSFTWGLQPGDLIVIGGRPSIGKTALATNIILNAALGLELPVYYNSFQLSKRQLCQRFFCTVARVDSKRLFTGNLKEKDWGEVTKAAGILSEAPIFINNSSSITIADMITKAEKLKNDHNIALIVVDDLQILYENSSHQEQSPRDIPQLLKKMARSLNIPVIVFTQVSRAVENRPNKRPILSDILDPYFEQYADLICFIYRDEVYNLADDNPQRGVAELIIKKNNNGPTGTAELAFIGKFFAFENLMPVLPL